MTSHNSSTLELPTLAELRRRGTKKWRGYPNDVIPMWVAESDFHTCPAVARAIQDCVDREYFGYSADDEELREALAAFYERRFGWSFSPDWVRSVPDVVTGVTIAVEELTPAGSAIVLPVPAYNPFFEIPDVTGRPAIEVPMTPEGGFDLAALEEVFASGTATTRGRVVGTEEGHGGNAEESHGTAPAGSLILCNPYNPLGRVFSEEELRDVVELAAKHNVRVISDEIHAPIVYPGHQHTPAASISEIAAENTITVTATSKGWNTAGLRCAQMILSSPRDREIMAGVHKLRTGEASTIGIAAATAAYSDESGWLEEQIDYLSGNLDLLERRLPEVLPGAKFHRPEGTYLLWVDARDVPGLGATTGADSETSTDPAGPTDPAEQILQRAKVAFNTGAIYGAGGAGHLRINFATSREILTQALDRIAAAGFGESA
ncbi:aminotransferase class I/II-fold pyridoxal phosphate-dependent enzyme [Corynebacterium sp. UMB9976]|uniref:MalY/PatB family protein n=1 Tax=Corynebacterium sp. UMB9976 TaxID=3046354 RepID=UPI00254D229A|nr:aminotransferase class I/II-fold pyridoxal phosphate-dependent enzyme [Corynebacterium sp. UMB9976]MDK6301473.1 aminotransferase class I/II-fold pyridoxal phosphate-dependent enzyme [Corynebacterium sp. UMB9976]